MSSGFLGSVFRRLPPVSRRDDRIGRLARRVARLEKARDALAHQPSFMVRLNEERRLRALEIELGAPSRSVIRHGKFHVYDLVTSHGIAVPRQYGRWDDPADIPWSDLPDLVVVKSAFSSTSHGVFPLRRRGDDWQVITHDSTVSSEQLTAELVDLAATGRARPPFGAEEFLDQDGTLDRPPTDVKAYAFYGEVPIVQLRQSDDHGNRAASRYRYIDVHGVDVIDSVDGKPTDQTIPVPDRLGEIVDASSRLSRALRAAFSRIDMYAIGDQVVFGEITPRPGVHEWLGRRLDVTLGDAWERAQVRLWRDLANGMSPEPEWGPDRQE